MIGNIRGRKVAVSLVMRAKRNKNQVKRADLKVKTVKRVKVVRRVIKTQRKKTRREDQTQIDNKDIIYQ